ncbi:MAG: class I tRNA ligase family protein [Candidatus Nomurabacteria bacterium]|nr:class I tRNA ligase family protein [Candidatus Nomurabacteria bacterium]
MKQYDHNKIEKKWQKEWEVKKVYKTENSSKKKKYYVLDMFPYPSGAGLHVGHPRGYIGSDVYARMKRMQGYNVLHPMGYDAFGLPAEQYAIEHKIHPRKAVEKNIKTFRGQLDKIGFSYDWSREVNTTDPEYYKWTQWIFLQIYNSYYDEQKNKARPISELIKKFEKTDKNWKKLSEIEKEKILMNYRLAYEGYSEVNWCPKLGTVLANDEIVDDKDGNPVSERGGYPVEKKSMRQWFMRITAYADRLVSDLDGLNWSSHIKEIQKNWIGVSEGSEIEFKTSINRNIKVFTTRADTLFGVTYVVLSPEHTNIGEFAVQSQNMAEVTEYIREAKERVKKEDITVEKEKTGVELKGIKAINPANGEEVPVWVADYVLASYGTGAVMAVPLHDERDREFAEKYNLPIIDRPFVDAKEITEKVNGKLVKKYKIRDAVFARQRYWGEPIPLIHNADGTIRDVADKKLPLVLPSVTSYEPTGTGESPLAGVKAWAKAGYETNTMPGWAGSSWYFLRYMDPKNKKAFADKKMLKYWKDVDMYVGGQEHATGHLLYSRFWHKFLFDMGYVPTAEPFKTLKNQGMILASDGRKMSKRWGNVINPDDIVKTYGADTLRVYEMFMGPFEASQPWNTDSIIGSRRFIEKVWRIANSASLDNAFRRSHSVLEGQVRSGHSEDSSKHHLALQKLLHKTIKKVSEDIENFSFNTAISAMMVLVNEMDKAENISSADFKLFLQILAPFAPHITEEIWREMGEKKSINIATWPKYNPKLLIEDTLKVVVQINGKVRAEIDIPADASEEKVFETAFENENVKKWIPNTSEIKKKIYVKGRLINFVV